MDPPYPRDDLDAGGRAFFADLAADSTEQNVARVRPDFMTWRTSVDPDVADDAALAERWLASLPPEDRVLVDGDPADVAGHAREAIGSPEGYLADAALVFAPWTFRVEDVRCPVTLWYGERDAHAPARNGTWLASTSHESH
jgi:pimeloyl-ACP methyl ester carboxylesterase